MGNPIETSHLDTDAVDDETLRCIKNVKDLSPQNIKIFLEHLFGGMSLIAKETVVDILWASMTLREQHLFDMPTAGRRLTDEEIHRNFSSSELNVIPRRVVRDLHQVDPLSRSLRTRTGLTTQIWPRIGYSRAVEGNSNDANPPEIGIELFQSDNVRRRNLSNSTPNEPGEIGDHILTLLIYFYSIAKIRDVVMRAELNSSRGGAGSTQEEDSEHTTRRSRQ